MHNIKEQGLTGLTALTQHQDNENYISFGGYASVFGVIDKNRDVVMQGAFQRSIINATDNIKLLWQHDLNEPIGYISHMEEDEIGLYVKGMIIDNSTDKDLTKALQHKLVDNLSIGYTIVLESPHISVANCIESGALNDRFNNVNTNDEDEMQSDVRLIHDLELVEISLVSIPCNNYAKIIETKTQPAMQTQQTQAVNASTTAVAPQTPANATNAATAANAATGQTTVPQSEQSVAPQVASSLSAYLKSIISNIQAAQSAQSSQSVQSSQTQQVPANNAQPTTSTAVATTASSAASSAAPQGGASVSTFNTQTAIAQINAIEARLNSLMQYMEEYPSA